LALTPASPSLGEGNGSGVEEFKRLKGGKGFEI